jgi:hypothetical protein
LKNEIDFALVSVVLASLNIEKIRFIAKTNCFLVASTRKLIVNGENSKTYYRDTYLLREGFWN